MPPAASKPPSKSPPKPPPNAPQNPPAQPSANNPVNMPRVLKFVGPVMQMMGDPASGPPITQLFNDALGSAAGGVAPQSAEQSNDDTLKKLTS